MVSMNSHNTCNESFLSKLTWRQYVQNICNEQKKIVKPHFECDKCQKIYYSRAGFLGHWRITHSSRRLKKWLQICPICDVDFESRRILSHLTESHNITIDKETHTFPDETSFQKWKKEIEQSTSSFFILRYSVKRKQERVYQCHSSGVFQRIAKSTRKYKRSANRIDGYCPAAIHVTKLVDRLIVNFKTTHVGHGNESCFLPNSQTKDEVPLKLIAEVPKQTILRDIQNLCTEDVIAEHLMTIEDVDDIDSAITIEEIDDEDPEENLEQIFVQSDSVEAQIPIHNIYPLRFPNLKKEHVQEFSRTILGMLRTHREVVSFYNYLERYRKRLEISRKFEKSS